MPPSRKSSPKSSASAVSTPRFAVGSGTDVGRKRAQNQDSLAVHPELGLFVVADGMGGHRGGETASAMAVQAIPAYVREHPPQGGAAPASPRATIADAIVTANNAIYARSTAEPALQGMGTTTTALLFHGDRLFIGHVGDSRCYYYHRGDAWQATRDHSLVQEKLRAGLITREEAKNDRMKNVITRSVGYEAGVSVEIYEMPVKPGDVFLICSDGLSGLLDDRELADVLRDTVPDPGEMREEDLGPVLQHSVSRLIELANSNGGDDNITAVLIEVTGVGAESRGA